MTDPEIRWSGKDLYPKEYEFLPTDLKIPDRFLCPISQTIMVDPVTADDGQNYEYKSIKAWINKQTSLNLPLTSPWTRADITKTTCINIELRGEIQEWVKNNATPEMTKSPAPSTTTASSKPPSQTPATKTATGVAIAEASVSSATAASYKPQPQAPARTTVLAQAGLAAEPENTASDTPKSLSDLIEENYIGRSLEENIVSQVTNF